MTWADPTTRQTGDLITAAIWNQEVVDNVQLLHDREVMLWITEHEEGFTGTIGDFAAGSVAYYKFSVPDDFDALVSADVAYIANTTNSETYTITTDYGNPQVGENYNAHSGSVNWTNSFVSNRLYWGDISGALSSLAPGDVVGIKVQDGGSARRRCVGLRIIYTRL